MNYRYKYERLNNKAFRRNRRRIYLGLGVVKD